MKKLMDGMRAMLAVTLAVILAVCAVNLPHITEEASNDAVKYFYSNGVRYEVSLDDEGMVIVAGDDGSTIRVVDDGKAIATVKEGNEVRTYNMEIETLTDDETNVSVYDEYGSLVYHVSDNDELDFYTGQVAITAGTYIGGGILVTILGIALKLIATCVVAGIVYYGAKEAVQYIKKSSSRSAKYYPAILYKGNVVIAVMKPISKSSAVSRLRCGNSIYTFTSTNARAAVVSTGLGVLANSEIDKYRKRGYIYFYHYHTANRNGAHAWYGTPVIG